MQTQFLIAPVITGSVALLVFLLQRNRDIRLRTEVVDLLSILEKLPSDNERDRLYTNQRLATAMSQWRSYGLLGAARVFRRSGYGLAALAGAGYAISQYYDGRFYEVSDLEVGRFRTLRLIDPDKLDQRLAENVEKLFSEILRYRRDAADYDRYATASGFAGLGASLLAVIAFAIAYALTFRVYSNQYRIRENEELGEERETLEQIRTATTSSRGGRRRSPSKRRKLPHN